jgi:hypothetical protein
MSSSAAITATDISVRETLLLFDGEFRSFADGVVSGNCVFGFGSGISRNRVDDLPRLIVRVLEQLRQRSNFASPSCPFRKALEEALALASLNDDEKRGLDLAQPVQNWTVLPTIIARTLPLYSDLLGIVVQNEEPDYLLWEAIDVCSTYADPSLVPDSEHLCIAILSMEGVIPDMASANWDGLIESACFELAAGSVPILRVCVRDDDLRQPSLRSD